MKSYLYDLSHRTRFFSVKSLSWWKSICPQHLCVCVCLCVCVRGVNMCVCVCVFHLDAIRAQTNNWIQLLYFSRGFIGVDRRSIGVCRVRHFLSTVENLTLHPPPGPHPLFLLFLQLSDCTLSFPLLIFPRVLLTELRWAQFRHSHLPEQESLCCYSVSLHTHILRSTMQRHVTYNAVFIDNWIQNLTHI